jgi:hypothetical protein
MAEISHGTPNDCGTSSCSIAKEGNDAVQYETE